MPRVSDIGRNDPCPCGSGKKYKRCHLAADDAARTTDYEVDQIHDVDHILACRMNAFAVALAGEQWLGFDPASADDLALQFLLPVSLYHVLLDGKTVARRFMEAQAESLSARERKWLDAQMSAWLSVWEVESVDPGRHIWLRDLLTGERRELLERSASKQLVARHTVLGRIVDFEGQSYICGMHPAPLTPLPASDAIGEMRRRLRVKSRVSSRRLRGSRAVAILIDVWDEALDLLAERARKGPTLANTDGDPLVLITDRFVIAAGNAEAVKSAISRMPGVRREDDGAFIFLRDDTIVATARPSADVLIVETNSLRRADSALDDRDNVRISGPLQKPRGRRSAEQQGS